MPIKLFWRGITDFDIPSKFKHTYFELFEGSLRFLFLPLNDTKIFWLAVQKEKNFTKKSATSIKTYLLETYKNFDKKVLKMLEGTAENEIIENKLGDIKPKYKDWFQNNTVFIGDSIHATTPNLAQGAGQAIEDAYTLGLCLKKHSPKEAFSKYQKTRIKKVKFVVKTSWKIGEMSLNNNTIQKKIFRLILKYYPQSLYQKRFLRLFDMSYLNDLENTKEKI